MDPAGVNTDRLRRDIDATRVSISETVSELRQKVGEALKWQTCLERHPTPILTGAVLVGLVVGRQIASGLRVNGRPGPGPTRFMAVSAPWQKLGSRAEGLVNRVIDEVADAAERALVPALVGSVQTLLETRGASTTHRPGARSHAPSPWPEKEE
jgi:hypothetical protein